MVAKYCTYVRKEPGETVVTHGPAPSSSHGMFIVLKGTLGLQVPDPYGRGIVQIKEVEQEEVAEETVEEVSGPNDLLVRLSAEELNKMPDRERRKYKTRLMLQDILEK